MTWSIYSNSIDYQDLCRNDNTFPSPPGVKKFNRQTPKENLYFVPPPIYLTTPTHLSKMVCLKTYRQRGFPFSDLP